MRAMMELEVPLGEGRLEGALLAQPFEGQHFMSSDVRWVVGLLVIVVVITALLHGLVFMLGLIAVVPMYFLYRLKWFLPKSTTARGMKGFDMDLGTVSGV